jgi:thiosulfate/3-mercaptopyruvate sulfurtransferase
LLKPYNNLRSVLCLLNNLQKLSKEDLETLKFVNCDILNNCIRVMNHSWKNLYMTVAFFSAALFMGCSKEGDTMTTGVLVSTDWLQDHLSDPDVVILHSGSAEIFDSIHIPGARLIIPYDFTVESETLGNEMPSSDSIAALLRSVGVDNGSRIVLYNESSRLLTRTARVFVAMDRVGLGERTVGLNGGLPAWEGEKRELSDLSPVFSPGNLVLEKSRNVIIGADELDRKRWSHDYVVIDARTDEEYYGTPATEEDPAEGGHIEGANFLPYQDLLDDSSYLFRPDTELEELFRSAGSEPKKYTVVYCGSGVRASVDYLAARHLGYPVLLYDGSYEEWKELDYPLTGPVALPDKN